MGRKFYTAKHIETGELKLGLMRFGKAEAKQALRDNLTWSNCFDTLFLPTAKELRAYKIVEVRVVEVEPPK